MVDENLERITILLQARDRDFARAMDRNNKLIARMSRDAEKNTDRMAARVGRNLDAMSNSAGQFAIGFAGGIAGGLVMGAINMFTSSLGSTIKSIAQIGDEAKRSGLGAEAFQEWKFVAEQNRIGVDQLVDGFKELNLRADELIQTGTGPAAEAFARLGYSSTDLARRLKDPSELMLDIINRMEDMDAAAQIRIADEIFGGSAGERFVELLDQGDEGIRGLIDRAHEVGAVLDEQLIAKAQDVDRKFHELGVRVSNTLKGIAVDFVDFSEEGAPAWMQVLRLIGDAVDEAETLGDAADKLAGTEGAQVVGPEAARAVDDLAYSQSQLLDQAIVTRDALIGLVETLDAVGNVEAANAVDGLIDRLDSLTDQAAKGQIGAVELRDELVLVGSEAVRAMGQLQAIDGLDLSGAQSAVAALIGTIAAAAGAASRLRAALPGATPPPTSELYDDRGAAIAEARAGSYANSSPLAPKASPRPKAAPTGIGGVDWGLDTGGKKGGGGGGGKSKDEYVAEAAAIREETAALEAEAVALLAVAESGRDYGDAVEYARKRAELMRAAQLSGKEITPELTAEIDKLAQAYVTAGENAEAAADRLERIKDTGEAGAEAISDIFSSVLDGSKSAKEALGDLLMEMAKVQLKQGLLGAFGGSGFAGLFGSMLTPIAGARASGGGVARGSAYLVNENTPNSEVFVPSRSGAVLTVAQAQSALRSSQTRAVMPAVEPAAQAEVRVRVFVDDAGKLAAIASQAGAEAALPVAVEVVRRNNVQQTQAQRRK